MPKTHHTDFTEPDRRTLDDIVRCAVACKSRQMALKVEDQWYATYRKSPGKFGLSVLSKYAARRFTTTELAVLALSATIARYTTFCRGEVASTTLDLEFELSGADSLVEAILARFPHYERPGTRPMGAPRLSPLPRHPDDIAYDERMSSLSEHETIEYFTPDPEAGVLLLTERRISKLRRQIVEERRLQASALSIMASDLPDGPAADAVANFALKKGTTQPTVAARSALRRWLCAQLLLIYAALREQDPSRVPTSPQETDHGFVEFIQSVRRAINDSGPSLKQSEASDRCDRLYRSYARPAVLSFVSPMKSGPIPVLRFLQSDNERPDDSVWPGDPEAEINGDEIEGQRSAKEINRLSSKLQRQTHQRQQEAWRGEGIRIDFRRKGDEHNWWESISPLA